MFFNFNKKKKKKGESLTFSILYHTRYCVTKWYEYLVY